MGIVRTNCYIIGKGGGGSGTADLPTHLENLTIITSNQCATLTLSYSNTDFVTGVRVCYKRNSYPTSPTDGDYVEVNEVAETVKITGLTNLITYYFRVFLYRIVDDTTYFQTDITNAQVIGIPCSNVEYFKTLDNLSFARGFLAGATVGNYALFAGGSTINKTVDAYDAQLVHTNPSDLANIKDHPKGASVGDYAVFYGGSRAEDEKEMWDFYNSSLVRTSGQSANGIARHFLASASIGNYALFAGGKIYGSGGTETLTSAIKSFDTNLIMSDRLYLSKGRCHLAGATVGNYALFAGGFTDADSTKSTSIVDAFDSNLTRSSPTGLSYGTAYFAGASVNNYALFAGGRYYKSSSSFPYSAYVWAYDSNLVRTTATELSYARSYLGGSSSSAYAIFGGGGYGSSTKSNTDAYDNNLVQSTMSTGFAHQNYATATIGDYSLFAGGSSNSSVYAYIAS